MSRPFSVHQGAQIASRPFPRRLPAKSSKSESERLFGKYDDLIRLLLGFFLTGVLGTYLSHKYTTEQSDLASASKIFNDYSKLAGDRYFAQNRLYQTLKAAQDDTTHQKDQERLLERVDAYQDAVQTWNSARGFNREMIKLYFGQPLWNAERDIHYKFRSWGQALEAEVKTKGSIDYNCMDAEIDRLLSEVNNLQSRMAKSIQEGKVGSSKSTEETPENKRPKTMCIRAPS